MARKDFTAIRNKFARDEGLPFGRLLRREYVLDVLESVGCKYRQRVFCPSTTLAFPQVKTDKAGLGFPIMRAVALISLSTGAVVDFACGPFEGKGTGEGALLRGTLDTLYHVDVLVADRYYPSYRTLSSLLPRGIDLVSIATQLAR